MRWGANLQMLALGDELVLHGVIEFRSGDRIDEAAGRVPEAPGAYVVWGVSRDGRKRQYLGKSGCNTQPSEDRGLRSEIAGPREDGASAQSYYEQLIEKHGLDCIRIEWFLAVPTVGEDRRASMPEHQGA
jgi:hypothetical protein